jgi:hypothetical protein
LSRSHTPLWQTSFAASLEHCPFSVGVACAVSVGIGTPLASVGTHMCAVSLHQVPFAVQSASTLQPPAGAHSRLVLHAPERHTVAPSWASQGPSPVAKPQALSRKSQTPLAHAALPARAVHVPSSVGE